MRSIVSLMHLSLDGYTARAGGSLDFVRIDDALHDEVHTYLQGSCDTAIYGRATYQMMEAYWPTAGKAANASRFDVAHSAWVEKVEKVVFSRTRAPVTWNNTRLALADLAQAVAEIKNRPGKDAVIFGSPSLTRALAGLGLIDEYRLTLNPELVGRGVPMFDGRQLPAKLSLVSSKVYGTGLIALHYRVQR